MISWMDQREEPRVQNQDLNQDVQERENGRTGHIEDGTTSENKEWEEEEEEVPLVSKEADLESSSGVAQPVLVWKETCETCQGSCDGNSSDGGGCAKIQEQKPTCGRRPWKSRHCRLGHCRLAAATPRFFGCPDCGKQFTLSSHLIRHQRVHTGERPFGCRLCPKNFSQRSDLIRHERTHTGVKLYRCTQCDKSFSESSHLIRHQIIHSGEKPFQCNICGKHYGDRSYLTVHQRAHTGARPYHCARCGKSFGRSSTLIRHQRVHGDPAPSPGDKPRPQGIWTAFAHLPSSGDVDSGQILSPHKSPPLPGSSLKPTLLPLPSSSRIDPCSMIMGWQWGLE